MRSGDRRRGFVLIVVLIVLVLTAGTLALIASWGVYRYRELQLDRVRFGARVVEDSALAYARLHLAEWATRPPDSSINLDLSSLGLRGLDAQATVSVETDGGRRVCRVATRVERGSIVTKNEIDLPMDWPSADSADTAPSTGPTTEKAANKVP